MLNTYSDLEERMTKKITSVVVFSSGGVSYEEAWTMSPKQLNTLDETVNDKIKLMSSTRGMF